MQRVDLTGPLPSGTAVLEASAGTGKTYTIAGLVARYVAEGHVRLDQLLVVTFGRAATSELRTRVRERLLLVRAALGHDGPCDDPVVGLLRGGDRPAAVHRLSAALASFDAATVATTHEFCQQVLHTLGTAADLDPGTVLVDDLGDLVTEVADDLYLRCYGRAGARPADVDRPTAQVLARAAVADRDARLLPEDAEPDSAEDMRVRFAAGVRREVERRKRALGLLGFDDLLTRVRDALTDAVTGEVARRRLRERYQVVLVDEFQDTDPVQWDVLRLAFHGERTLVVIGDPKQAVYAFRGADVRAYLDARRAATSEQTLDTSWRSDPAVLDGLRVLLRGAALGHPEIVVRDVLAGHTRPALEPADPCPVRLRVLQRDGVPQTRDGVVVGTARSAVARDVAAQVLAMLAAGETVVPRDGVRRPLTARDVAVLVRKTAQAQEVRTALLTVGVPVVLTGTASVFATPAADDWRLLLEALEQPHRSGRVRRLALTSFVGWTAAELDAGGAAATDALALQVRRWGETLASRGVAALYAVLGEEQRLAARLLRRDDGERLLTDLRHVAEALHEAALGAQLGLSGLLSWLRGRIGESGGDLDQERSRRLDTESAAVQVVTIHTSKGLEFPVVLVPFGWDSAGGGKGERLPRGHDASGRTLYVGGPAAAGYGAACRELDADEAGEELRLLYVAVTRAVSRLVLWWVPTFNTKSGPLHRLLFCPDPSAVPPSVAVPDDLKALTHLRALGLPVELVDPLEEVPPRPPAPAAAGELDAARLLRGLDLRWRRTSYTGLTRAAHEQPSVGSEPEQPAKDDEPVGPDLDVDVAGPFAAGLGDVPSPTSDPPGRNDSPARGRTLRDVASPMADLPAGAAFGTLVHAVLEHADLTGDAREGLRAAAAGELRGAALDPDVLADALLPAVSTPLGPLAGGRALRDVAPADLLAELTFELPLAGGDRPCADVRLAQVADLLRTHLPAADPVAPYADALEHLGDQALRGYLTGSVDAVVRAGGRYLVLDHKTNRLAPYDEPLTAWHYRRSALDEAVRAAHYPLQALLYEVALHRYLRWRQPGYDPARHLGGVLYLFLRGMCGPGVDAGVWSWHPPATLVVALSDLLAGVS